MGAHRLDAPGCFETGGHAPGKARRSFCFAAGAGMPANAAIIAYQTGLAQRTDGKEGGFLAQKKPLRVLQVMPAMNMGGMENFVMNVYRRIDRSRVQFDFLYHYAAPSYFDSEILALGGRIYRTSVREDNNFPRYFRALKRLFAAHPEWKVLHGHYSGFGVFYNHYAKKAGVGVRAGHSHNTTFAAGFAGLADRVLSRFFRYGVTHRFACGQEAGRALYGRMPFAVVPNGVDPARFARNPDARTRLRSELEFEKAVVYGHVGRFDAQKNHQGLLAVFAALARRQPEARLVLLGRGPLEEAARETAHRLGIANRVHFAGVQTNTPDWYAAMDAFLLPSNYEGLPVVLIEAQAAGLPCFVSTAVTREAGIAGVEFLPLAAGPEAWADAILARPLAHRNNAHALKEAGYDIADVAAKLQAFYLESGA